MIGQPLWLDPDSHGRMNCLKFQLGVHIRFLGSGMGAQALRLAPRQPSALAVF